MMDVTTGVRKTSSITVTEKDTTGNVTRTYLITTTTPVDPTSDPTTRLDLIPNGPHDSRYGASALEASRWSPASFFTNNLLPVFLPHGYPHTVTADYTPYQIYDSLQAFASTIAGLLSSRAVLQSLGFDSDSSSSTATYATLLSVAQATISNLSTILFAHYVSSRIAPEVKFYRFLADIVNDAAFVLDCLSPSLPSYLRVSTLCVSSALRALCGVAGGSSKAVLSAHFAKTGNIGELNAKDGSQETVIGLAGMWVGGVVVTRVDGVWATWLWLSGLLGLHLWWNYCAIWHVRLTVLNRARASIVMTEILAGNKCPDIEQMGKTEGVLGIRLRSSGPYWRISICPGLADIARFMDFHTKASSGSLEGSSSLLFTIFDIFQHKRYILWYNPRHRHVMLVLKDNAEAEHQLEAWCHATRICQLKPHSDVQDDVLSSIKNTLDANEKSWQHTKAAIEMAGWDTSLSMLELSPGRRVHYD